MLTNHKKVNRTRKVVRKSRKLRGGNRKVNRSRKIVRKSGKMCGGMRSVKPKRFKGPSPDGATALRKEIDTETW